MPGGETVTPGRKMVTLEAGTVTRTVKTVTSTVETVTWTVWTVAFGSQASVDMTASTSTAAPLGRAATPTAARAG